MNYMTVDSIDAPWNQIDFIPTECHACGSELNEGEQQDPCMIDDEAYCDKCASNLIQLRIDGYISQVHEKTFKLKYNYHHGVFASLSKALKPL